MKQVWMIDTYSHNTPITIKKFLQAYAESLELDKGIYLINRKLFNFIDNLDEEKRALAYLIAGEADLNWDASVRIFNRYLELNDVKENDEIWYRYDW